MDDFTAFSQVIRSKDEMFVAIALAVSSEMRGIPNFFLWHMSAWKWPLRLEALFIFSMSSATCLWAFAIEDEVQEREVHICHNLPDPQYRFSWENVNEIICYGEYESSTCTNHWLCSISLIVTSYWMEQVNQLRINSKCITTELRAVKLCTILYPTQQLRNELKVDSVQTMMKKNLFKFEFKGCHSAGPEVLTHMFTPYMNANVACGWKMKCWLQSTQVKYNLELKTSELEAVSIGINFHCK